MRSNTKAHMHGWRIKNYYSKLLIQLLAGQSNRRSQFLSLTARRSYHKMHVACEWCCVRVLAVRLAVQPQPRFVVSVRRSVTNVVRRMSYNIIAGRRRGRGCFSLCYAVMPSSSSSSSTACGYIIIAKVCITLCALVSWLSRTSAMQHV